MTAKSKLVTQHVYLIFDVFSLPFFKVGEVKILIHKEKDIECWKNPDLLRDKAIDTFRNESPDYKEIGLNAYYTGDLIPFIE